MIEIPTRFMPNVSPSTLGQIYRNDSINHLLLGLLYFDVSDHLPMFLRAKIPQEKKL